MTVRSQATCWVREAFASRMLFVAGVWLGALSPLPACSWVVSPVAEDELACEVVDGVDPCVGLGDGYHCTAAGRCERCVEQPEACDGVDNDCDGTVDEGHDQDADGVTWCGEGVLEYRDCDDNAAEVYPATMAGEAAPELCDGKDNDCDGAYDEGGRCESENCVTEGCPEGTRCDEPSGRCIGPRSLGAECRIDAECGADFCVEADLLLLPGSVGERVCARACCSDADCPSYASCHVGVDGIRACIPNLDGEREAAGSRCRDASSCASQACVAGRCAESCASSNACDDAVCSLGGGVAAPFGAGWACGQAAGNGEAGVRCTSWDLVACRSGFCESGRCAQPCGSDAECSVGERCDFRSAAGGLSLSAAWLPVCVPQELAASASACCNDGDCVGEFGSCRPERESTRWSMRCSSSGR